MDRKGIPDPGPFTFTGRLIALDSRTGKIAWEVDGVDGSLLALSTEHDALVVGAESSTGLVADRGGPLAVYRASNGEKLWETGAGSKRPIPTAKLVTSCAPGSARAWMWLCAR